MKSSKLYKYFPFFVLLVSAVGLLWSIRSADLKLSLSSTILGVIGSFVGVAVSYGVLKSISGIVRPKSTVFMVHVTNDKEVANRISLSLKKYRIKVIDEDEVLSLGDNVLDVSQKAISTSDYVLFIVSVSATKDYFFVELMHRSKSSSKKIIPILVDEAGKVPNDISNYRPVDTTKDFNKATEELALRLAMS